MLDVLKSQDLSPRLRILLAVKKGYKRFSVIASATTLALSTVSKYVNILTASGLLVKNGRNYELTNKGKQLLEQLCKGVSNEN